MSNLNFILLVYKALGNKIQGKTNLQKRVFFLATLLKMDLGYEPHYFGPYSVEVTAANEKLKALGFLQEAPLQWGAFNEQGFEMVRYDYMLTEAGQRVADLIAKADADEWQHVSSAAHVLQEAGELDYMELSVAAKAYFILSDRGRKSTLKEIEEIAPRFGWHVTRDNLVKAARFLENVGLVHTVPLRESKGSSA